MSLIKSHHTQLDEGVSYSSIVSLDVIKEIVINMLNKHASLIVDIETNHADPQLLHQEIIRYLDDTNQFQLNRDEVIREIINYMFGYGILQNYIEDEDITDIDICRYDFIIIKKQGLKAIAPIQFSNEQEFTNFCKLVVIRNGGVINENDCHARVADTQYRLRINVSIPPRNVLGTSMTIRKHRLSSYTMKDLLHMNMFDKMSYDLLVKFMKSSSRILIVGKGASGKTTLLRALLSEIPITERFLVCESDSELYPENPNFIVQKVIHRQKKKAHLETLVRDGLTMSLDGYCVGELVGNEVYEFIKAGYTDHRIIGTLHALGINETIPRIISMINETHQKDLIAFIAKSIDLIIYMRKFKIAELAEVFYDDRLIINPLMKFNIDYETDTQLEGSFSHVSFLKGPLKYEIERRML